MPLNLQNLYRNVWRMVKLIDNLRETEGALRLERESLLLRVQQIDGLIEQIRGFRTDNNVKDAWIPPVKPDDFKGLRPVDALESYLRARREFGKIPFKRAVLDLLKGGVQPGASRGSNSDPARLISHTLKISLPNKTNIFYYEPFILHDGFRLLRGVDESEIVVCLATTANEPKVRKRSPVSKAANTTESPATSAH